MNVEEEKMFEKIHHTEQVSRVSRENDPSCHIGFHSRAPRCNIFSVFIIYYNSIIITPQVLNGYSPYFQI